MHGRLIERAYHDGRAVAFCIAMFSCYSDVAESRFALTSWMKVPPTAIECVVGVDTLRKQGTTKVLKLMSH
jgi:hypothetical protein